MRGIRPGRLLLALLLAASASPAAPAAEAAPSRRPLTPEDLWAVRRVGNPAVSPDGSRAVYTVSTWDPETNRSNSDLWEVPLAGGEPRRLTTSDAPDTAPAFSPDGKRIAFLSRRGDDKETQLYLLDLSGGEPERLSQAPLGASSPKWLPDGKRVAFVSPVVVGKDGEDVTKKALEEREKEGKTNPRVFVTENRVHRHWDHALPDGEFPHLFVVDLATRQATDLLPGSRRYGDLQEGTLAYAVSPDGSSLVFEANSTEPPYRTWNTDLFLVPSSGGVPRNLTADNPAEDKGPVFSPDGRTIAFGRDAKADGWPDRTRLALLDVGTGKVRVLTEEWRESPSSWRFTKDGRSLVLSAEVRARGRLFLLPVSGGAPREAWSGGTLHGFDLAPAEAVFTASSLTSPAELFALPLDGSRKARALTRENAKLLAGIELGSVREMTFAGAGGDEVQMFVVLPPGAAAGGGKPVPLVHLVHGGPIGTFGDGWLPRWNAQAFAARGYAVAMVNFHGSSSFGQPFLESILGAPADKPFDDVMKATDLLVAKGLADPARMAAAGGSYGGYLVDWIEGHTDRFRCLVSHAGVYSLTGQWASDATEGRQHSYGGYPWNALAKHDAQSPNRFAASFATPMLVVHGERDYRVPATQGLELYGVLAAKGVPARLVLYPDENHWVLKGRNSLHWYGEVLGWLDRWLKPGKGETR